MNEWTRRWLEALGDPHGRYAARGEALLRSGRVSEVRIEPGLLAGSVQGTRATPYVVELRVPLLSDSAWDRVAEAVAAQVRHTARLLAGQAPEGLDEELEREGVTLVPRSDELEGSCGCGDVGCAHRWAVWLSVARRLDADPFALLLLRGRGRQRLLEEVARRRGTAAREDEHGLPIEALDAERWWQAHGPLDELVVAPLARSRAEAPVVLALGDPTGWAGGVSAHDLFRPLVKDAAEWAGRLLDAAQRSSGAEPSGSG